MRFLLASAMLASAAATPALARDEPARPFDGFHVSAIVGVDDAGTAQARATGIVYGGQLAYDLQSGQTVFGIEGELSGASARACYTRAVVANDRLCDRADRDVYVGGRVGRVVGNTTLLYVKGGYTNVRDDFEYRDGATGRNNSSGSGTRGGIRGGVGVETRLSESLSVKAEYRYSDYSRSDLSRNQGVAGVSFRF